MLRHDRLVLHARKRFCGDERVHNTPYDKGSTEKLPGPLPFVWKAG